MQSAPRSAGSSAWTDAHAVVVGEHELAGLDLALERRADEVERAGLGGDDGVVAEPAEHERPEAVRVAEGEQRPVGEADDASPRPRAAPSRRRPPRRAGARRRRSARAITSESEVDASGLPELGAQLVGVDEVAVVAERDGARRGRGG